MAEEKIKRIIEIGGAVSKTLKRSVMTSEQNLKRVGDSLKLMRKQQKALNEKIADMTEMGKDVSGLQKEYNKLGDSIKRATLEKKKFQRRVGLKGRIGAAGAALGRGAKGLGAAGAAVGAAGAASFGVVQTSANAIEEQRKYASNLGLTVEKFSRLSFVADQFGITQDALTDGFKELQIRADEFALTGGGGGAEAFERLGLTEEQLAAVKGDTDALFKLVHSRLSQVQDTAAQQRLADEIFGGQGGEQFIEMLRASGDELERLKKRSDQIGATTTKEDAERSREYLQRWRELKSVAGGVHKTIGLEVMGPLTSALAVVGQVLIDNRESIRLFIGALVEGAQQVWPVVSAVGGAVFTVAGALFKATSAVAGFVGGFGNLAMIVGGLYGLVKVFGVLRFAVLAASGPIGWIVGGITALIAGVSALWSWISGDDESETPAGLKAMPDGSGQFGAAPNANNIVVNISQRDGEDAEQLSQRVIREIEAREADKRQAALYDTGGLAYG